MLTTVKHGSYCLLKCSRLLQDVKSDPMLAPAHPTVAFGDCISLVSQWDVNPGNYQRAKNIPQHGPTDVFTVLGKHRRILPIPGPVVCTSDRAIAGEWTLG